MQKHIPLKKDSRKLNFLPYFDVEFRPKTDEFADRKFYFISLSLILLRVSCLCIPSSRSYDFSSIYVLTMRPGRVQYILCFYLTLQSERIWFKLVKKCFFSLCYYDLDKHKKVPYQVVSDQLSKLRFTPRVHGVLGTTLSTFLCQSRLVIFTQKSIILLENFIIQSQSHSFFVIYY